MATSAASEKITGGMDDMSAESGSGSYGDAAQLAGDLRSMLDRADLLGPNLVAIYLENAINACDDRGAFSEE